MPIRSDLQTELERLEADAIDGAWSLVVWADRAVKKYSSRHLASLGKLLLEAWDTVQKIPTTCSMAIYRSEDLRVPGATDFLVLFRSFAAREEPPFILGEEELHAAMRAEAAALRELESASAMTAPLTLEIELF